MGTFKKILPVKLIMGFIYKDLRQYTKAKGYLVRKFGPADYESEEIAFLHTRYYEKELGADLKRRFISFKKLAPAHTLAKIKSETNRLEEKLSHRQTRSINIDPGYLNTAKLVLATTKDYAHRIYLNKGIYAEVTLTYRHGSFIPWEWTYPDYRTEEYLTIFNHIRKLYEDQIVHT
jgi:hypothetical protein